jgi:hypothetical protein
VPTAAVDACYRQQAVARPVPLVAECHTDHPAGRWVQVFCANTYRGDEPVTGTVDLGPAWPDGPVVALDLRTGAIDRPSSGWETTLEPAAWTHHLLAPILPGGVAVFGDVSKHAPVGKARVASIEADPSGIEVTTAGAGETVVISGWSEEPLLAEPAGDPSVRLDAGRWSVEVPAGSSVRLLRA